MQTKDGIFLFLFLFDVLAGCVVAWIVWMNRRNGADEKPGCSIGLGLGAFIALNVVVYGGLWLLWPD